MGQKLQGAAVPFFWGGGELDVPIYHNVAWAEAYLELPSGILIHPVVWPQYTNVTKQTHRQQSDSIGEPFIQTVVQNGSSYAIGLLSVLSVTVVYCWKDQDAT